MSKKKLWFRARNYGWGWSPTTLEGWIVTLTYLLVVIGVSIWFDLETLTGFAQLGYIIFLIVAIVSLILICYKTGEKPEWRWGGKKIR